MLNSLYMWRASALVLCETLIVRASHDDVMVQTASLLREIVGAIFEREAKDCLATESWQRCAGACMDIADAASVRATLCKERHGSEQAELWREILECADLLADVALQIKGDASGAMQSDVTTQTVMRAFARAARLSLHRSHVDLAIMRAVPLQQNAPDFMN